MVLHQAGEVLHCDETGVLWVQLRNKSKGSRMSVPREDISLMNRDFFIHFISFHFVQHLNPRKCAAQLSAEVNNKLLQR